MENNKGKSENSEKQLKINHPNIKLDIDFEEGSTKAISKNDSTKTEQQKDSTVDNEPENEKPSSNDLKERSDYNGQVRKDKQHPSDKKGGVKDKNLSQKRTF